MVGKPAAAGDASSARFLHELQALDLAPKPPSAPKSHRSLPSSAAAAPKPKHKLTPSASSKEKTPSLWSRLKLNPLSSSSSSLPAAASRHRRFDCRFTLHVHSIDNLPPPLADAAFSVHWKRTTDSSSAAAGTRSTRASRGAAHFDETLVYRCSVSGSRRTGGHSSAAKYESRDFVIWVTAVGGAELGRHLVDLTRLLPLTLEELEDEEKRTGKWSTSFRLSGKARGATLNVSFGFAMLGDGGGSEKKVSETANVKADVRGRGRRDRARSVEDVKVLHKILPGSKSEVSALASALRESEYDRIVDGGMGKLEADPEREFGAVGYLEEDSSELKLCTSLEPDDDVREKDSDEPPEFIVIEQGVEIASEKAELDGVENVGGLIVQNELRINKDVKLDEISSSRDGPGESSLLPGDPALDDLLESALSELSILDLEVLESPQTEANTFKEQKFSEFNTNCMPGSTMSRSLSLDDATESIANEFLSMLEMDYSSFGLSPENNMESPREHLWKQFEKESLAAGDDIFVLDSREGMDSGFEGFVEDSDDLSSIVLEAETEFQKAAQYMDSKSRAKMLEDAESEALMHEWGLNAEVFRNSPPGSRSGFGSPIYLHPEESLELPPLSEGLGPFLQTKGGGFVRSMNPSLFKNAKNNGSLIMQVSSPVVVPAEMGSGVLEILQGLASIGIEKLSMQAKKLMPLEDISGKTMQQVAWESAPSQKTYTRQDFLQNSDPDVDSGIGQNASGRKKKKGKSLNLASLSGGEMGSEYVSLEDLAPLAMDKIEALSIEGLRIQSGMSDQEATSNINPPSIGDVSAMEGKGSNSSRSLGLEGAAGLQLLDVKDNGEDVDGLMGLSITLDEWMRLDSGIINEEDQISDRTSKILAAHHACSTDFVSAGKKGDKPGGKRSGKRYGLLGNNFTVVLMVQLRDPLRDYEPVGAPMLALIQVERVFVPPKPKIYSTVSEKGNSEQDDEPKTKTVLSSKEEKKKEADAIPQFKITEVHVAGLKAEPGRKKYWGDSVQQQSGSRWLLANGMGKTSKKPFMRSKSVVKPSQTTTTVQPGDTLWSISSRVHGTGAKWKELAALNPHIRNPNVLLPNQTIRLR